MSMNHWPSAVERPKASSSRKPHTVGGSTMGMVKMASKTDWARGEMRMVKYAAPRPRMKMKMMATSVVRSVTHRGL